MVVSLHGIIANEKIIFNKNEKGLWEATIPCINSGRYIVELYAIDDAGNESYYAAALLTVDVESLKFEIKVISYNADVQKRYKAVFLPNEFSAKVEDFELVAE